MVYEEELVGLTLVAALIQQLNFLEDATIAIDNQAAIKATMSHKSGPGQQLTNLFHNQMSGIAKQHRGVPIKIYWVPGHKGIPGNEEADKLAKQAVKQRSNPSLRLPSIYHSPLPCSKTASKANFARLLKKDACALFQKSPRYNRIHTIDPKAPSSNYKIITEGLTQHQSRILMQL